MTQQTTVAAGTEIHVGAPASPLPEPLERALRDAVQAEAAVSFACVPLLAVGAEAPERALVVFLRRGTDVDAAMGRLSAATLAAVEATAAAHPALAIPALALLPVPLARPLDGVAQAVLLTGTELYVADAGAWQRAKAPALPWWRRLWQRDPG